MTFRFCEKPAHADASFESESRKYTASGETDQTLVHALAFNATPSIITHISGLLYRQNVSIRQTAYNQFDVEVAYGKGDQSLGSYTWDFDTTGGTVHITSSKETVKEYPTGIAPLYGGAIGVNKTKDEVAGIDITIPALRLNVRYRHPAGVVTIAKVKALSALTGMVSSTPFLGFAAYETLFLGARGSDGSDADAEIGYSFAMSPNATGLTIGSALSGIDKRGWDALWVSFESDTDTPGADPLPILKPKYAYVERVYETVDLASQLGFGS